MAAQDPSCSAVTAADNCARGGDTSSSRSLQPWPRSSTTQPHGTDDGQGWGGGSRGARRRSRRIRQAPSTFPPGRGLTASLASGRRNGYSDTPWISLLTACQSFPSSMYLCRRSSLLHFFCSFFHIFFILL